MSTVKDRHRARAAANREALAQKAAGADLAEFEARLAVAIDAELARRAPTRWFKLLVVACFFAGVALAKKMGV